MMYVALGEEIIDEFLVSTGAYRTPTPTGRHTILGKNHVRIGGDGPYIMPRFQLLGIRGGRFTGYGIHALPSIGTGSLLREIRSIQARGEEVPHEIYEGNALWTEAVEHLGTPVSHGCIRVAPDQADFLFDYTEVGETELIVERSLDQNRIQEILQEVI
jgi:lipoprotein-anchoring transpeptidase ErfK/SrfK